MAASDGSKLRKFGIFKAFFKCLLVRIIVNMTIVPNTCAVFQNFNGAAPQQFPATSFVPGVTQGAPVHQGTFIGGVPTVQQPQAGFLPPSQAGFFNQGFAANNPAPLSNLPTGGAGQFPFQTNPAPATGFVGLTGPSPPNNPAAFFGQTGPSPPNNPAAFFNQGGAAFGQSSLPAGGQQANACPPKPKGNHAKGKSIRCKKLCKAKWNLTGKCMKDGQAKSCFCEQQLPNVNQVLLPQQGQADMCFGKKKISKAREGKCKKACKKASFQSGKCTDLFQRGPGQMMCVCKQTHIWYRYM